MRRRPHHRSLAARLDAVRMRHWRERSGRLFAEFERPAKGDGAPGVSRRVLGPTRSTTSMPAPGSGLCGRWPVGSGDLEDDEIRSYVLTAVANQASKELRRRRRKPTAPLELVARVADDGDCTGRASVSAESSQLTRDLLASLPPRRRAVMLLRYGWGLEPKPGLRPGRAAVAPRLPQGDHARSRRAHREDARARGGRVVRAARADPEGLRRRVADEDEARQARGSSGPLPRLLLTSSPGCAATSTISVGPWRLPAAVDGLDGHAGLG